MDPILAASATALASVFVAVLGALFNAQVRRDWDIREDKKKVYRLCLSSIGSMVREGDKRSRKDFLAVTAKVTPYMTNWSSPKVFLNYLQLRLKFEAKHERKERTEEEIEGDMTPEEIEWKNERQEGMRPEECLKDTRQMDIEKAIAILVLEMRRDLGIKQNWWGTFGKTARWDRTPVVLSAVGRIYYRDTGPGILYEDDLLQESKIPGAVSQSKGSNAGPLRKFLRDFKNPRQPRSTR